MRMKGLLEFFVFYDHHYFLANCGLLVEMKITVIFLRNKNFCNDYACFGISDQLKMWP